MLYIFMKVFKLSMAKLIALLMPFITKPITSRTPPATLPIKPNADPRLLINAGTTKSLIKL